VELEGVPGLRMIDLVHDPLDDEERSLRLRQLADIHLRYFAGHEHVIGEIAEAFTRWPDDEVVVHPWLLLVDDVPVGEYICHANLRRGIVLMHFLAMDHDARRTLPDDWRPRATEAARAVATRDAAARGRELVGMMAEIPPEQYWLWEPMGFHAADIGYLEPRHGRHWPEYDDGIFMPMQAIVRRIDAGEALPLSAVATAGLEAFLIDHYRLPRDHPVVATVMSRAALLA
jgi:hypothetical protein